MKKEDRISDEQLNAFLDGELDAEERTRLFDEAEQSTELDQRLCHQRKVKELVKHAYQDISAPRRLLPGGSALGGVFGLAIMASVLLIFGFTSGLFLHGYLNQGTPLNSNTVVVGNQTVSQVENYLLHIASGDPKKLRIAVQRAQELLASAGPGEVRKIEVVANGRGLDLLRSDVTQFAEEIRALSNSSVMFYACANTIERLEEKGIRVKLMPEVNSRFTAVDHVVKRIQEGWSYIKI